MASKIEWASETFDTQKPFLFIDFWATWCAPCRNLEPHIEQLSKVAPDKVSFIQISRESSYTLQKYIDRYHSALPLLSDFQEYTHQKFEVRTIPYGVLLNGAGEVLWRGHPADLQKKDLSAILRSNKSKGPVRQIIEFRQATSSEEVWTEVQSGQVSFRFQKGQGFDPFIKESEHNWLISGPLSYIMSEALDIPRESIQCSEQQSYQIQSGSHSMKEVVEALLKQEKLKMTPIEEEVDCYLLSIRDSSLLWSTELYDYAPHQYILSEHHIEIDNASLKEVCSILSQIKQVPFLCDSASETKHDWNIYHHTLPEMRSQLSQEYGLNIQTQKRPIKIWKVQPMATEPPTDSN